VNEDGGPALGRRKFFGRSSPQAGGPGRGRFSQGNGRKNLFNKKIGGSPLYQGNNWRQALLGTIGVIELGANRCALAEGRQVTLQGIKRGTGKASAATPRSGQLLQALFPPGVSTVIMGVA